MLRKDGSDVTPHPSAGDAPAASPSFETYGGTAAENYERYFVPAIAAPLAAELVGAAGLRAGERVIDVACGTGVVARLAAERVGAERAVAGVDVNAGMLAVARAVTPPDVAIEWHEVSADALPFADGTFDVVLCQMGLQFFPDRHAALREARRVLVPGGRLVLNVPGPTPAIFRILAEALARHVNRQMAHFVHHVFSLHDAAALADLIGSCGFVDVSSRARTDRLRLPAPGEFLWQYVRSTPLAAVAVELGADSRAALARDVVAEWEPFVECDALILPLRVVTVTAHAI
jgi:SAM-dependent methyltransferase